jgi:membrane associated rhomboid family serine protease
VFPLRPGRGTVSLHATGFRHPGNLGRERFTGYGDLTHLVCGSRALRIGTRRGTFAIPRRWFARWQEADALVRALIERIAREPEGALQLARMAEIEELACEPYAPWAARAVALACVAAFALEVWLGPAVHHAGFFSAGLAASGEPWRLLTANLLHADPVHLFVNTLGLLALGSLVERTLGSARTIFVMGVAALGATLAGMAARYDALVGASGVVAGLAGALLWLELRLPDRLPATWRLPRGLFIGALLADAALPLVAPFIAGAAHAGGFAAGAAAAAICGGPRLRREPLRAEIAVAVALVCLVAGAAVLSAARLLAGGSAWEGHAARLLRMQEPPVLVLNDAAWLIATGRTPTRRALVEARELAERAVRDTQRSDPNLLDTLAEVQFQSGDGAAAVETIDEAIALAPEEPYFREQRRRFTGERAADDRPPPPEPFFDPLPVPDDPDPLPRGIDESPGIEI